MSSDGDSSPIFRAEWLDYLGCYRVFEVNYPSFTVAFIRKTYISGSIGWFFDPYNCSDDFRPPLLFEGGPLAGQHSYPLDITVLTDTDDLLF